MLNPEQAAFLDPLLCEEKNVPTARRRKLRQSSRRLLWKRLPRHRQQGKQQQPRQSSRRGWLKSSLRPSHILITDVRRSTGSTDKSKML